jgi:hypothetical protein
MGMGTKMNYIKMKKMVDLSGTPEVSLPEFPGSKLLGYGWEWKVYGIKNSDIVIKVPRDVFPEINTVEYFNKLLHKYDLCMKYFNSYVAESQFERRILFNKEINIIYQNKYPVIIEKIVASEIKPELKRQFLELCQSALICLKKEHWLPDFNLRKDEKGAWEIRNIMVDSDGKLKLIDFGAYYGTLKFSLISKIATEFLYRKTWKRFYKDLLK